MLNRLIIVLLILPGIVLAQGQPASNTTISIENVAVSIDGADSSKQYAATVVTEVVLPIEKYYKEHPVFGVYTKTANATYKRTRLFIQVAEGSQTHLFSIHDSLCINPEKSKVLFQKSEGDSVFCLIGIDAFSKASNNPYCDAGKETKVVYLRWNTKTQKSRFKQRTISSCLRGITNLSPQDIFAWQPSGNLELTYHKGGDVYITVLFDPKNWHVGFQSSSE
ncbi:MAG: hypothetical protein ACK46W_04685 [Bacteroidota bacterium]